MSLLKNILYTLFKVDSLLNFISENKLIKDINENNANNNNVNSESENNIIYNNFNINENIMNDFLASLKYQNSMILLNSFIVNGTKYKNNNDLTENYFCIFNQFLILYNNAINVNKDNNGNSIDNDNENNLEQLKERLYICNKVLLGEEIISEINNNNYKEIN